MTKANDGFVAAMRAWIERLGRSNDHKTKTHQGHVQDRYADDAMAQMLSQRRSIETSIPDAGTSRRFMDRVIAQWRSLGEKEPFWSNDMQDQFKRENITDATIDEFYDEGSGIIGLIGAFESRTGVDVGTGVCLELGCGVGKHTHALARRFERVIGVDVSGPGLEMCAHHMRRRGLDNVTTMLLTTPEELSTCGAIDFFMCLSVLQHNPPPIQKQLLELALAALRPGGYAYFQTPDYRDGYTFSTADFLAAADAWVDIHCLPKTEVLETLDRCGMVLLDFAPDVTLGGSLGSYMYFARKR